MIIGNKFQNSKVRTVTTAIFSVLFFLAAAFCPAQNMLLPELTGREVNQENCGGITSFNNNPESIAAFFAASLMQRNTHWEAVADLDALEDLREKIAETYSQITLITFRAVEQELLPGSYVQLTVLMELEYDGEREGGTDQMTLKYDGAQWKITSVPL